MDIKKIAKFGVRVFPSTINLIQRQRLKPIAIRRFNIEVTEVCDGNCIYCNIHQNEHTQELTSEILRDGLKPRKLFSKVQSIGVTGGEPFLHKDLVGLCQTLKSICPQSHLILVTNGLRPEATLKTMIELREIDPKIRIGVSIDGFSESDGIQRGNPTHSEKAWKTYRLLKENGFPIGVGSVVTRINKGEILSFSKHMQRLVVDHGVMAVNTSSNFYLNVDNEMADLQVKDIELFKQIYDSNPSMHHYYLIRYLENPRQVMPCFSGFNSFFLAASGTIFPCIQLNEPWGNIKDAPFGDIWFSHLAKSTRKKIVEEKCHCYTSCEVAAWLKANDFPVIKKALCQKLYRSK